MAEEAPHSGDGAAMCSDIFQFHLLDDIDNPR